MPHDRGSQIPLRMAVEAFPNLLRSATRIEFGRRMAHRARNLTAIGSWRDLIPGALVLACGGAIALGGFLAARDHLVGLERRNFEVEAAGYAGALRDGVRQYAEALNAMAAFVSASRGVDRWEFLRFAERTLPRYPGFAALEWVPRVPIQYRARYERRAQVDGLFGLRIRELGSDSELVPAADRPEFFPVYYVEPFEGHDQLLGFDLASDPVARAILSRAEQHGRILGARLPPGTPVAAREADFWFVLPLFDGEITQKPVEERHETLLGFAIGAIRIGTMVDAALEAMGPSTLAVRMIDEMPASFNPVLYARGWDTSMQAQGQSSRDFIHASSFEMSGGTWRIEVAPLASTTARPQDALPWGVALISLLLTGLLLQHMAATILRRRGIERAVQARTTELANANRDLQTEISERRRAEINLRHAKETAELANRAKSEFLAMVSHELKTPLNAIIGFSDILANQTLGPIGKAQYLDYASDIRDSGHYLLKIINDILDLSRIETGNLTLVEEEIDIGSVVQSAVRLIRPRAEAAGLTLITEFPAEILCVLADARAMKQILVNLLSNAVKFTPGGGRVTASVGVDEGMPTVTVADTGIGIPANDLERVCEPFVQVDTSLARRFEGTGLGLTLTKRLVDLHGGELILRSAVGMGTTVIVRLPVERRIDRRPR
ncbi:MAG TPA: CHASE domain-containing protein [Alphaproteobacteria bacterium]|nr:CHASE domain-containing protein [Alphaproteobacteria bacterium]